MLDSMSAQNEEVARLNIYMKSLYSYNPQWITQHSIPGTDEANAIKTDVSNEENKLNSSTQAEKYQASIQIEFADEKGRQLVASKDIMPGEVILKERFLIMGPLETGRAGCLACLKPLEDSSNFCEGCKSPLCIPKCNGTGHHPKECEVLARTGLTGSENSGTLKHLHHLLTPLRTLLMIAEQKDLASLLETLEGNVKKREHIKNGWDNENKVSRVFYSELLASALQLIGVTVDPLLVKAICGVWDTNAFEVYVGPENKYAAQALFPLVSMMNHSCVANVMTNFKDDFMYIRASTQIKKGEAIALNYRHMLWGTRNRRRYLLLTKLFLCQCPRCNDPTELGSHVSSIRCQKCRTKGLSQPGLGLYVPNPDHSKPWDCNNCPHSMPARLADTITGASEQKCSQVDSKSVLDIKKKLVLFQEGLGPQHFLCVELRRLMVMALTTQPLQDMDSSDLWLIIDLTSDMLKLAEILEPGISDFRGQMLLRRVRAATQLIIKLNNSEDISEVDPKTNAEEEIEENEEKQNSELSLADGIEVNNIKRLEIWELTAQCEEFESILQYDPAFSEAQDAAIELKKAIEHSNITEISRT